MKPYEHYLEAEEILERTSEWSTWEVDHYSRMEMMAVAQVHATLALVRPPYPESTEIKVQGLFTSEQIKPAMPEGDDPRAGDERPGLM